MDCYLQKMHFFQIYWPMICKISTLGTNSITVKETHHPRGTNSDVCRKFYTCLPPPPPCGDLCQTWCQSLTKNSPQWLHILLIALSNDVHQNPGPPFHNSFFTFMSWNVNSIAVDNFQRVRLIEADNSIFNHGFISIWESSLNDSIKLPGDYKH